MKITKELTNRKVRADSLSKGDGLVDVAGHTYIIISSNPDNLEVKTILTGILPKVLVCNLRTVTLGWFGRGAMVTPVNLELIVTESQKN